MNKKFSLKNIQRIPLNIPVSLIIIALAALAAAIGDIFFTLKSVSGTFAFIAGSPLLFLLNFIPILLAMLFLFFLFGNAVFASLFTGALFGILGIVNLVKTVMRQDPLIPSDLTLFTEAFEIVKGFSPRDIIIYASIIIVSVIVIIAGTVLFKSKKMHFALRICLAAAVLVCGFALNGTLYSNKSLYASFPVDGNQYFEVNQYASKGFVYSFIYKFNTTRIEKPEGYNKAQLDSFENEYAVNESLKTQQLPNIIMIMGEAYSDLSENEHFDFSSYTDPMENFKAISQSENAQSGHIIVPSFGGGTSDTEFEVLTGLFKRGLNSPMTAYSLIRKDIDALPQRLKDIGYDTLAVHPGFSWFYNRINVYNYMGFDRFIHLESFQGEEKYRGGYIADKYATDCLIEEFENHRQESDKPFFQFCVTIENHGPYDEKYNTVEKMFDCDVPLTEKEETLLNSYFMGIRDADIEIKRLTDYFEQIDEPVVIVYFGDHLPGFSNGMEFFDKLDYNIDANGTDEQVLNVYKTPYLIWQNSKAAETGSFAKNKAALETPYNTMSAAYLGAYVTELFEINGISPVFDYINQLRKEIPVITNGKYLLGDGSYTSSVTDEQAEKANILKHIIYYKMFE